MLDGLVISPSDKLSFCSVCSHGKQTKKRTKGEGSPRAKAIGDIIHSDVCGLLDTLFNTENKYFVTFIVDHSRKIMGKFPQAQE